MITYKKAGVDIDAGNELVERIKKMAPRIGGFSDGMALPKGYKEPILIGCTDGVGTKLAIAQALDCHDTIGFDLVGMNVNDLICSGARPLFFLDYFACGKLDVGVAEDVVRGIVKACKESDCELIGGETAEMPGFYKPGEYDLAGFATGVVEKKLMLKPKDNVKAGDILIGIPSSGLHSNGYSLVRKLIPRSEWKKFGNQLLAPTRLYVRLMLPLLAEINKTAPNIRGLVHITGGGFTDNVPRVLPKNLSARIEVGSWKTPPIFTELKKRGRLSDLEMLRTFNNGVGLVAVASPAAADKLLRRVKGSIVIGALVRGDGEVQYA